jgi:hypothetical protein
VSQLDVIATLPWKVGPPLKRGVFAVSPKPEATDPFVAIARDPMVAAYLTEQHNEALKSAGQENA